eukprot:CAMPEP_0184397054 /NCGR_PEP_ID=MMETSP0007-20130409/57617_1 /TAXON_ID=97485 /ORGANISM="Prymnesium parvum, Strain Texoma1" /LENGTH=75 /DNA_ID=CAMNT_0026750295 /DNA_START=1 /DNA_END=228 /DNA_ORIENTATION=+
MEWKTAQSADGGKRHQMSASLHVCVEQSMGIQLFGFNMLKIQKIRLKRAIQNSELVWVSTSSPQTGHRDRCAANR